MACRLQVQARQQQGAVTEAVTQQGKGQMFWQRCPLMVAFGCLEASTTASSTTKRQASPHTGTLCRQMCSVWKAGCLDACDACWLEP